MAQARALHVSQQLGQEMIRFTQAVTTPFFMDSMLPIFVIPYKSMVEATIAPLSDIVLTAARELTKKDNPFIFLYASGNRSFSKGMLKQCTSKFVAVGSMMAMGYFAQDMAFRYLPDLIQSENPISQFIAKTIIFDEYRFAVLRPASYVLYRGLDAIGMKIWDCVIPSVRYEGFANGEPNFLQKAGGYVIRWGRDVAITEAALYFMRYLQYEAANFPRFQISLLLMSDVVFELGEYLSDTSKSPDKCQQDTFQDLEQASEEQETESHESNARCLPFAVKTASIVSGLCLATVLINEISMLISPRDSNPEQDKAFQQRMIGYASFALPLGVKLLTEQVGPKVMEYCRARFFKREGERAPLVGELESVRTYSA